MFSGYSVKAFEKLSTLNDFVWVAANLFKTLNEIFMKEHERIYKQ